MNVIFEERFLSDKIFSFAKFWPVTVIVENIMEQSGTSFIKAFAIKSPAFVSPTDAAWIHIFDFTALLL